MSAIWGGTRVRLVRGDITDQEVDAVVNAANSSLMGGGGVDGAIHRRGGPAILEACKEIRRRQWPDGMPMGEAVITTGGRLRARYVIHTVGPVWKGGNENEPEILASCYRNSLSIAGGHAIRSIAFPSISTGAYGYPVEEASRVALRTVKDFVEKEGRPAEVVFVLFTEADLKVYLQVLRELG
jgi:O-acetyl-ADP-ribose deacetylase (regulator of RNase III)